jgi:hypothetical protein
VKTIVNDPLCMNGRAGNLYQLGEGEAGLEDVKKSILEKAGKRQGKGREKAGKGRTDGNDTNGRLD